MGKIIIDPKDYTGVLSLDKDGTYRLRVSQDRIANAATIFVGRLRITSDVLAALKLSRQKPEVDADSIHERAFEWLLSGDTGISSETLCAYMLGIEKKGPFGNQAPSDAADRGRCIRLLQRIPEWVPRLDELKALDTGTISINGAPAIPRSQDSHSWTHQLPLLMREGGFIKEYLAQPRADRWEP